MSSDPIGFEAYVAQHHAEVVLSAQQMQCVRYIDAFFLTPAPLHGAALLICAPPRFGKGFLSKLLLSWQAHYSPDNPLGYSSYNRTVTEAFCQRLGLSLVTPLPLYHPLHGGYSVIVADDLWYPTTAGPTPLDALEAYTALYIRLNPNARVVLFTTRFGTDDFASLFIQSVVAEQQVVSFASADERKAVALGPVKYSAMYLQNPVAPYEQ